MGHPTSLRQLLLLGFLLVAVIPMTAMGLFNALSLRATATREIHAKNLLLAKSIRGEIHQSLLEPVSTLRQLPGLMQAHMPAGDLDLSALLQSAVNQSPLFESILLLDHRQHVVVAALPARLADHRDDFLGLDLARDAFVQHSVQSDQIRWSDAHLSPITGQMTLSLALPSPGGLLLGLVSLDHLGKVLAAYAQPNTSLRVSLIDNHGALLYDNTRDEAGAEPNVANLKPVTAGLAGTEGVWRYRDASQNEHLGSVVRIAETGWLVLVSQPTHMALVALRQLGWVVALGAAIALLLSLLGASWFAWQVGGPLGQLGGAAHSMARGNYSVALPQLSFRETRDLAEALDSLRNAVQERETALRQEREGAERAMAEAVQAHRSLDAVVDAVADPLIVTGSDHRVTLMNRAASALFGLDEGHEAGLAFGQLFTETDICRRLIQAMTQDRPEQSELELVHQATGKSGTYQVLMRPVRDGRGELLGLVTYLRDITQLRDHDRLKSEFISMAAHELRTPLTAIQGFAELLEIDRKERLFSEAEQNDYLRMIVGKTEQLERIVSDLLQLSRSETGRPITLEISEQDIVDLLERALRAYQQEAPHHSIRLNAQTSPINLPMDPTRIQQVLDNLLTNAVKYTPGGGEITLTAHVDGHLFHLQVADEGIGIDPDHLPYIFDRFYRVHADNTSVSGLGLGLSIARSIIDAHGGRLWAESTPGKGSIFHVTLPREQPATDRPLFSLA